MTRLASLLRSTGTAALFMLLAGLLTGCATKPKVDWSAKVGIYTFDDAVIELGPPDKQAKLSEGSIVAEWLTSRGGYSGYSSGMGAYGYHGRPYGYYPAYAMTPYSVSKSPDRFLRLVFDPEGRLASWDKFSK